MWSCSDRWPVLQVDNTLKLQVKIKRPQFSLEASNRWWWEKAILSCQLKLSPVKSFIVTMPCFDILAALPTLAITAVLHVENNPISAVTPWLPRNYRHPQTRAVLSQMNNGDRYKMQLKTLWNTPALKTSINIPREHESIDIDVGLGNGTAWRHALQDLRSLSERAVGHGKYLPNLSRTHRIYQRQSYTHVVGPLN